MPWLESVAPGSLVLVRDGEWLVTQLGQTRDDAHHLPRPFGARRRLYRSVLRGPRHDYPIRSAADEGRRRCVTQSSKARLWLEATPQDRAADRRRQFAVTGSTLADASFHQFQHPDNQTHHEPTENTMSDSSEIVESESLEHDEQSHKVYFQEIKEGARSGAVPTRELLSWYGRARRGAVINRTIEDDLENAGLRSFPPIAEADYYGKVQISSGTEIGQDANSEIIVGESTAPAMEQGKPQNSTPASPATGWILSSLKPDGDELDLLEYGDSLEGALEKMKERGRTKLPLFFDKSDMSTLIGTVTMADLTFDAAAKGSSLVARAQTQTPIASTDDKLFDWIPIILENGFIYGRDSEGYIAQIYTTHDVALHVNAIAQMFLRVNELEELIRQALSMIPLEQLESAKGGLNSLTAIQRDQHSGPIFTPDDISDKSQNGSHFEGCTFADYMKFFGSLKVWDDYFADGKGGVRLDRERCLRSLNDARKARNKVMHISSQEVLDTLIPSLE